MSSIVIEKETTSTANTNPGLAPYDLSNYTGVRGWNWFQKDNLIQRILDKYSEDYSPEHKADMWKHLEGYGDLAGSILYDLTDACHKEGKYGEFEHYDRTGNRVDRIRYAKEQLESRKINYEYGVINLDFHAGWKHPFTLLHKMALTYLLNMNGEGGVGCPMAMTDGLINIIQKLGTEEQQQKYLPLIAGEHSESHFMAGQYFTERVGGNNIAENRTVASRGEKGKWLLNGEKWFCSNPGDLWVTTARIEGTSTIGLFLVPHIKDDGEINGCHYLRKKDIIGSRGKVTAEAVYRDCEAEELGRPAHGLANIIKHIISISRRHVAMGGLGTQWRIIAEAREYARTRQAFNRKIGKFPVIIRKLAEMQLVRTGLALTLFRNMELAQKDSPAQGLFNPLMKYMVTTQGSWLAHEAIMIHGGQGIIGDFSSLPRFYSDAIINETWEGTHEVLCEHVMKAWKRDKIRKAVEVQVMDNLQGAETISELAYPLEIFQGLKAKIEDQMSRDPAWIDVNRLHLSDLIYNYYTLSEFIGEAFRDTADKSLFISMAQGFAEVCERGRMGLIKDGGIFTDFNTMEAIAQY